MFQQNDRGVYDSSPRSAVFESPKPEEYLSPLSSEQLNHVTPVNIPIRERLGVTTNMNNNNRKRLNNNNDMQRPNHGGKRWKNYNKPYQKSHKRDTAFQHMSRANNKSVNSRFDEIRNNIQQEADNEEDLQICTVNTSVPDDDVEDLDITVAVEVNTPAREQMTICERFKMILDPKIQSSIQKLQTKIKEKQIIYPFAILPSTTSISMHERFTMY